MKVAFHAPMKPPDHPVPSGDRRMAGTLIAALESAGHQVALASRLRTWMAEPAIPVLLQADRDDAGRAAAGADVWLTYHCHYRAPDLLGPRIARDLGLGFVIVEPSLANKRAHGPWAAGHRAARAAIGAAHALLCPSRDDLERVAEAAAPGARLDVLPPALDLASYGVARPTCREAPVTLLAVGMMRHGDKLATYRLLGEALVRIMDLPWTLTVVGDGPARTEVEAALPADRTRYLGALPADEVAKVQAACDIAVWPGIGEAYGMALLEAQAAGMPVVAGRLRGVPDVVPAGVLVRPNDAAALAEGIAGLIRNPARRAALGAEAARAVQRDHSLAAMARRLDVALDWAARRR